MKAPRSRIFLTLALAVLMLPGAALAQSRDGGSLADTIDRLERQIQTLERTVYRGAPPPAGGGAGEVPPAALSQLQITSDSLEEQMRRLTGQVEQLDFQIRQLNDRMDRLVADVDFRLRELEDGSGSSQASRSGGQPVAPAVPQSPGEVTVRGEVPGTLGTLTESQVRAAGITPSAGATSATPSGGAENPSVVLPEGSTQDRYSYARQFLLKRDFASAEQALSAFVETHPEDPLAGNAQYWLGETFYVRGDYQTAARTFAEGFQRYPDSDKAPDNLLKLGMSLAQLDLQDDACITLKKLRVEYPEAPTSIVQRADREIGRLKCS
jgi:tol-pal system protein YbgF